MKRKHSKLDFIFLTANTTVLVAVTTLIGCFQVCNEEKTEKFSHRQYNSICHGCDIVNRLHKILVKMYTTCFNNKMMPEKTL